MKQYILIAVMIFLSALGGSVYFLTRNTPSQQTGYSNDNQVRKEVDMLNSREKSLEPAHVLNSRLSHFPKG
ncbi:hypothetical protein [Enterobacter adelaidei]